MSRASLWEREDRTELFAEARERLCAGLALLAEKSETPARLLDDDFADALMCLMQLVLEKDKEINLTAITDPLEFTDDHLLDSLSGAMLPEIAEASELIDVGTGAGFPGLPLALLFPKKRFILADSLRKRTDFISFAANELGLDNVTAVHIRAEALGRDPLYREKFDVAFCRAVASLPVALEYLMPLVKTGGAGVFYKTVRTEDEIGQSETALLLLGASPRVRVVPTAEVLPEREHALYVVPKEKPTPANYPRRDGKPKKSPL